MAVPAMPLPAGATRCQNGPQPTTCAAAPVTPILPRVLRLTRPLFRARWFKPVGLDATAGGNWRALRSLARQY